jgi:hypothetical protein
MQPRDPSTRVLDDSESGGDGHDGEADQAILNIAAGTNDSSATSIPELSVAVSDSSKTFTPLSQKVDKGLN